MEIKRLTAENYDELLALLNLVFGIKNKVETHFDRDLPIMWKRDDESMGKHFGAFEDGKLVAALGVYPLPVNIMGENLLFSTMGNVATHPDYEGRGYMSLLLEEAMKELDRINADASRLGGLRARYGRYGFEMCGTQYSFTFTPHNLKNFYKEHKADIVFERIRREDGVALEYACNLYDKEPFRVYRGKQDNYFRMYCSMTAWQNIPYIAKDKSGNMVGFLSVKNGEIAEIFAESNRMFVEMILSWVKANGAVSFKLCAHRTELIGEFYGTCENMSISSPSRFKIINYKKIISALLKLKQQMCTLSKADFTIEIEGCEKLRIFSDGKTACCEDFNGECDVKLDRNSASRFLFGPVPPYCTAPTDEKFGNVLPLPLSWNLQDRV